MTDLNVKKMKTKNLNVKSSYRLAYINELQYIKN